MHRHQQNRPCTCHCRGRKERNEVHRHQQGQPCTCHCRYQRRDVPLHLQPCLQEWTGRKCVDKKNAPFIEISCAVYTIQRALLSDMVSGHGLRQRQQVVHMFTGFAWVVKKTRPFDKNTPKQRLQNSDHNLANNPKKKLNIENLA